MQDSLKVMIYNTFTFKTEQNVTDALEDRNKIQNTLKLEKRSEIN